MADVLPPLSETLRRIEARAAEFRREVERDRRAARREAVALALGGVMAGAALVAGTIGFTKAFL